MATSPRKIFIDSSVILAFIDRADTNHAKATKALENLARHGHTLYTSAQNIGDTYVALVHEIGSSVALDFLEASVKSNIEILFPQKADLITAYRILRTNRDRQISLREALNTALMQKKEISQVLTFTYWHNLFGTHVSSFS